MPPFIGYAPREQEYPEYEFLRRNLQQGRSGSRYNPAFEAMPQLIATPNFITAPPVPGEGKGSGMPATFMPGWSPTTQAGTAPPAAGASPAPFAPGWSPPASTPGGRAVTGEEATIQAYAKGQGEIETRGPFFPMPPMVKGQPSIMWQGNQYGTSPGQIQTSPSMYNGPTPFGDVAPPPPPTIGQFMAARVPMMPPAYADVQMEARNNAIQANARGDAMSDWAGQMDRYNRLNFDRQTQAADWALRRDLGMGGLGLQQRQLDIAAANAAADQRMREQGFGLERDKFGLEKQRYEQGRSPAEQERAMAATLIGAGKTPAEVQDFLDWWRQQYPNATYGNPPAPGDTPGSAKGGSGGTTTSQTPPIPNKPIYSGIKENLDKYFLIAPSAEKLNAQPSQVPIGEALWKLNQAQPGFVRAHLPEIESYVKATRGTSHWDAALGRAPYQQWLGFLRFYDQDNLGVFPGMSPTDTQRGNSALRNLVRSLQQQGR